MPPVATIPSSRAWDKTKDALKPALKAAGGGRIYRYLAEKYHWATVFLNYAVMRSPVLGALFGRAAWPQSLYVEGTNICNARCVFCAYPQMERPKSVMPMELFKSTALQYVEAGGTEVDLTPIVGDPFVDRFLFDRLDFLEALPEVRRFHFFTNAILIRPEHTKRLMRYGSKLAVYCSFGGFDRETYRKVMGVDKFEEAVTGIRGLIEAKRGTGSGILIQVNLRVPAGNARGEFWDYVQAAAAEGLLTIDSIDAYDSWAGKIGEADLASAGLKARPMPEKRGPCHRLITSPVVLVDGRVNACACRDVEAELIVGDVKTQKVSDILASDALHELLRRHDAGDFPDVCRRCTYYDSLYPSWMRGRLWPLFHRLFAR